MSDSQLLQTVSSIASDRRVSQLFQSHGLDVNTVSWEDTARTKGSCWGANITDMTLVTQGKRMPVIRKPNFADVTCDRPIGDFTVMVGNEGTSTSQQLSLKTYLENLSQYVNSAKVTSMIGERDDHILTSSQACVLPLTDGSVEFCVEMFNYQTTQDNPAVLVIMASSQGTSAQILDGQTTKVYFNDNGTARNLKADRLKDDRIKRGVAVEGPMTEDEKNRNALFVFQVPLKHKKPTRSFGGVSLCSAFGGYKGNLECASFGAEESCDGDVLECCVMPVPNGIAKSRNSRGLDRAVLSKGTDMGRFRGTNGLPLERDFDFPIRCTVQYYYVTDSVDMTQEQIQEIATTVTKPYVAAEATGSLVFDTTTRKTEPVQNVTVVPTAPLTKFL